VHFQLINGDHRFVIQYPRIDHHRFLRPVHVFVWRVLELHLGVRRTVVIKEFDILLFHDCHQAGDAEHVVGFGRAAAAGDDDLLRRKLLDVADDGPKCVRLRDAGAVLGRGKRLVGLHRDDASTNEAVDRQHLERVAHRRFNVVILCDGNLNHNGLPFSARLTLQRAHRIGRLLAKIAANRKRISAVDC
jgi:hypothetical protein